MRLNTATVGICNLFEPPVTPTKRDLRCMTPFNSTPLIWSPSEPTPRARALRNAFGFFRSPRLADADVSDAEFVHANAKHQSAWLIVDEEMQGNSTIKAWPARC